MLEAINSDAIDSVLIATSTPSHAEFLTAAVAAGKAVYCEKPIDLSLDKARRVVDEVSRYQAAVTVGFNRRFDPSHNQLKQHFQQGLLGKAELIQMVCDGLQAQAQAIAEAAVASLETGRFCQVQPL